MTTPTVTLCDGRELVHVDADGTMPAGEYVLLHRCDASPASFFCETHQLHVANLGNLVMHLEAGGEHRVALWCPRHRTYEAVGAEDLDLLRRALA